MYASPTEGGQAAVAPVAAALGITPPDQDTTHDHGQSSERERQNHRRDVRARGSEVVLLQRLAVWPRETILATS